MWIVMNPVTGQEPIPDPVEFWSERLSSAPDWPINILNRFFWGLEWVFARSKGGRVSDFLNLSFTLSHYVRIKE